MGRLWNVKREKVTRRRTTDETQSCRRETVTGGSAETAGEKKDSRENVRSDTYWPPDPLIRAVSPTRSALSELSA